MYLLLTLMRFQSSWAYEEQDELLDMWLWITYCLLTIMVFSSTLTLPTLVLLFFRLWGSCC